MSNESSESALCSNITAGTTAAIESAPSLLPQRQLVHSVRASLRSLQHPCRPPARDSDPPSWPPLQSGVCFHVLKCLRFPVWKGACPGRSRQVSLLTKMLVFAINVAMEEKLRSDLQHRNKRNARAEIPIDNQRKVTLNYFNKVKRKLRFRVAFPPDSRNNPQLLDEMTAAGYSATGW